jgi:hypothetical protein
MSIGSKPFASGGAAAPADALSLSRHRSDAPIMVPIGRLRNTARHD